MTQPSCVNCNEHYVDCKCVKHPESKHLIDCLHDDYLNDDFHVEVTLTVGEIANAAKVLGISDF